MPAPAPAPGSPDAVFTNAQVRVTFKVTSDWRTGLQAQVEIENRTGAPLNNWRLTLRGLNRTVSNIWNARVASRSGQNIVFDGNNTTWNRHIPARGRVSFGFTLREGNLRIPPSGFQFSSARNATPTPSPTPVTR